MKSPTKNQPAQPGNKTPSIAHGVLIGCVWTVAGSSGEYSDRRSWTVCAYQTETEAMIHVERAQACSDALRRKHEIAYDIPSGSNEWDPQVFDRYNLTRYSYGMTELRALMPLHAKQNEIA